MTRMVFLTDYEFTYLFIDHCVRGRGIANNLTLIKCPDPIHETFNDFHIVLDEHNSRLLRSQRLHYYIHKAKFFLYADAAGRLVKHHKFWIPNSCHRNIKKLTHPLG